MEYRGAYRMRTNVCLNFIDGIGKKISRDWALLVLAELDLSTASTRTAQSLDIFLPMMQKSQWHKILENFAFLKIMQYIRVFSNMEYRGA